MISDNLVRWLIFLVNPFAAMLISFKEYTAPYAKNIFWAFCVFYGLTFAIGHESSGSDINRYLEELQYLHSRYEYTTNDIINYFQQSGEVDILRTFLSYVISRFSDSQAILTTVYAIIFGFFFSRNIWYVMNLLEGRISGLTKMLILGLILVIPIWFINGFRMWTAFHVFMYGLLPYIFVNKKSKLLFVYLSFLVHFSFILPILVLMMYIIIGNRVQLFFIGFVLSMFVSELNISFFNQYIENYAPQSIAERSESYRNEDVIENGKEKSTVNKTVWYVRWNGKLLKWSFYILLIYLYIFTNIKMLPEWKRIFSITLVFFSVGNILSLIPSGGRYLSFSSFLIFTMLILYLNQFKEDLKFQRLIKILTPVFILFIIVSVRIGLYSTSITTIIGNPFIAFFNTGETVSINDLIK
ncbi:MAG: EpsG family protein [Flavobacteriaceae bacterium]|nr:EpsG family protein [Flavobacteriaceae bacterium]